LEPSSYPAKRPSISDVATAAGVSQSAVSKVLRGAYGVSAKMEERVNRAIADLGYRPRTGARAMRGRANLIGFEIPQLGNEFFTQIMSGANERLQGTGFELLIAPAHSQVDGQRAIDSLIDHQVDGIIAISPEVKPEILNEMARYMPLVMIGRHDTSNMYDTVFSDDERGITQAIDHLVQLGHKDIAHLTIEPGIYEPNAKAPHAVRLETYRRLVSDAGLTARVVYCDALESGAHARMLEILKGENRPTAVLAGNDTLAIGALRALAESGLTSADISIVGYDDIAIASHPMISLTTINQDGERVGREAVGLLLERIVDKRSKSKHIQIKPELEIRKSTEKPPKK
jgi:LacI family transcriptional regulator